MTVGEVSLRVGKKSGACQTGTVHQVYKGTDRGVVKSPLKASRSPNRVVHVSESLVLITINE